MTARKKIATQDAPQAIGPYSQAIVAGGLVHCSGQIAFDPKTMSIVPGDVAVQTERVLQNLTAVLKAAGTDLSKVVKCTVFLKSMDDFAAMNAVYGKHFTGDTPPARSTVEVARLPKDVLVEIDCIALAGDERVKGLRPWEWLCLACILATAVFLRTRDLTAFRLSPDDGQYLYSARLHELPRSTDLAQWIAEDRTWFGELVEDWGRAPNFAKTYQHSYLHQFLFRDTYRLGLSPITALRGNSAVLGALVCVLLAWFYARAFPPRRHVGLIAAALVAVSLLFTFYSRTGWGQMGCTCFAFATFALGWELLERTPESATRRLAGLGLLLALSMLGALGFQEMISVYVIAFAVIAFAWIALRTPVDPPAWASAGLVRRVLGSRRIWAFVLAATPIGLYTLLLYRYSEFANSRWFSDPNFGKFSWTEARKITLDVWWNVQELPLQISIPVLALALVGARVLWREQRRYFAYLAAWTVLPAAVFFVVFDNPSLVRIYLPSLLLVFVFAAEGCAAAGRWIAVRTTSVASVAAFAALVAFLGITTWNTLFGREGDALFVAGVYAGKPDSNHVYEPVYEYLEDHRIEDLLGAWDARDPLFVAVERGYPARMFSFDEPQTTWPAYLIGVTRSMNLQGRCVEAGGRYKLLVRDRSDRVGLYALQPAQ